MSTDKLSYSHAPGWLPRRPGTTKPFRGAFPMRQTIPMSEEMVAFLDIQAEELTHATGKRVTRASIIRECIARTAWDYFGKDIE